MPKLIQEKILPYSAVQMFELVMDIEKYPEFLPWCVSAKIIEQISDENLKADLLIKFKNFLEKYRSDVKYGVNENGEYFVDVIAIEGPFKTLINKWKFIDVTDLDGRNDCRVEFFLEFEFNSKILNTLIGSMFGKATEKMMSAFEDRAKEIF